MAKGQTRSNREVRKPKKEKSKDVPMTSTFSSPFTKPAPPLRPDAKKK